ncbi:MAG TPA: DUF58 domain-containing protein [Polyangiaceae bacterium]|nr:DUF58 domain-containing protein [Polyangiaceae bacterium]
MPLIPKELLRALKKLEITSARLANEQQLSGNYKSVIKGQGLAFQEVRPYQSGDDVRAIDWNVSARMNEPFIKVFTEEREMTVMLLIDVSRSGAFGTSSLVKRHLAAEIAAVCAFSAISHGDRVGLIATSDEVEKVVPPQKGKKHGLRVLREILELSPRRGGTDLAAGLETLLHVAKRRSVAFVISDFFASGYERSLALAAAKHDVIPIVLTDPRDATLPDVGLARFEDLETGEDVLVDTSSKKVRDHYQAAYQKLRAAQLHDFRRLGLDTATVATDRSYMRPLRDLFARRARKAHR